MAPAHHLRLLYLLLLLVAAAAAAPPSVSTSLDLVISGEGENYLYGDAQSYIFSGQSFVTPDLGPGIEAQYSFELSHRETCLCNPPALPPGGRQHVRAGRAYNARVIGEAYRAHQRRLRSSSSLLAGIPGPGPNWPQTPLCTAAGNCNNNSILPPFFLAPPYTQYNNPGGVNLCMFCQNSVSAAFTCGQSPPPTTGAILNEVLADVSSFLDSALTAEPGSESGKRKRVNPTSGHMGSVVEDPEEDDSPPPGVNPDGGCVGDVYFQGPQGSLLANPQTCLCNTYCVDTDTGHICDEQVFDPTHQLFFQCLALIPPKVSAPQYAWVNLVKPGDNGRVPVTSIECQLPTPFLFTDLIADYPSCTGPYDGSRVSGPISPTFSASQNGGGWVLLYGSGFFNSVGPTVTSVNFQSGIAEGGGYAESLASPIWNVTEYVVIVDLTPHIYQLITAWIPPGTEGPAAIEVCNTGSDNLPLCCGYNFWYLSNAAAASTVASSVNAMSSTTASSAVRQAASMNTGHATSAAAISGAGASASTGGATGGCGAPTITSVSPSTIAPGDYIVFHGTCLNNIIDSHPYYVCLGEDYLSTILPSGHQTYSTFQANFQCFPNISCNPGGYCYPNCSSGYDGVPPWKTDGSANPYNVMLCSAACPNLITTGLCGQCVSGGYCSNQLIGAVNLVDPSQGSTTTSAGVVASTASVVGSTAGAAQAATGASATTGMYRCVGGICGSGQRSIPTYAFWLNCANSAAPGNTISSVPVNQFAPLHDNYHYLIASDDDILSLAQQQTETWTETFLASVPSNRRCYGQINYVDLGNSGAGGGGLLSSVNYNVRYMGAAPVRAPQNRTAFQPPLLLGEKLFIEMENYRLKKKKEDDEGRRKTTVLGRVWDSIRKRFTG